MDERLPFSMQRAIAAALRRGATSVVGVGNPLLDLFVELPAGESLPEGLTWGASVHLERTALDRLCTQWRPVARTAGGGAANALAAMAVLGAHCRLAGAVGSDREADTYRADLQQQAVADALETVSGATGCCLVFLPQKSVHADSPAAAVGAAVAAAPAVATELDSAHVRRVLAGMPRGAAPDLLLLEGFLLSRPRFLEQILETVPRQTVIALSLGHPAIVAAQRDRIRDRLLPWVDLLLANEAEYRTLVGLTTEPTEDTEAAGQAGPMQDSQAAQGTQAAAVAAGAGSHLPLTARLPLTVVTQADRGATVIWAGGAIHAPAHSLSADEVRDPAQQAAAGTDTGNTSAQPQGHAPAVVDVTGAGDVFAGAFLGALFNGARIEHALDVANRAAAGCVTGYGGRIPQTLRDPLRLLLRAGIRW